MDDVIIRAVVAKRSPTHATSQRASPFVVLKTAPQAVVKHRWPAPPQVHTMLDSIRTVSTIIHTTVSNTRDYHNSRLSDSRQLEAALQLLNNGDGGDDQSATSLGLGRPHLSNSTEDDEDISRLSKRANWHSLALHQKHGGRQPYNNKQHRGSFQMYLWTTNIVRTYSRRGLSTIRRYHPPINATHV